MPRKTAAAGSGVLSFNELEWVRTLDVDARAFEIETPQTSTSVAPTSPPACGAWVTAPSSPTWETAAMPEEWPDLPAIPAVSKKEARRARNRVFAKVARERKLKYEAEMQVKIAEIEQANKALRAQVEAELEKNAALRESLGLEGDLRLQ
jgi:hypothetical protein